MDYLDTQKQEKLEIQQKVWYTRPGQKENKFLVDESKKTVVCRFSKFIEHIGMMEFVGKVRFDEHPVDIRLGEWVSKRIASARYHGFVLAMLKARRRAMKNELREIETQISAHEKKRAACNASIKKRYQDAVAEAKTAQA